MLFCRLMGLPAVGQEVWSGRRLSSCDGYQSRSGAGTSSAIGE